MFVGEQHLSMLQNCLAFEGSNKMEINANTFVWKQSMSKQNHVHWWINNIVGKDFVVYSMNVDNDGLDVRLLNNHFHQKIIVCRPSNDKNVHFKGWC